MKNAESQETHINHLPHMVPLKMLAAIKQTEVKSATEGKLLSSLITREGRQDSISPNKFHMKVL